MAPRTNAGYPGVSAHRAEWSVEPRHPVRTRGTDKPTSITTSEAVDWKHDIQGRIPEAFNDTDWTRLNV